MSISFPKESAQYRTARDRLLEQEAEFKYDMNARTQALLRLRRSASVLLAWGERK
jgi:hypothetical protein